jgi:predicted ArsR family transcriptional regulator
VYEIIVRVLRVVACLPRLRILALLTQEKETAPTAIARKLGIGLDLVCAHLAKLTSVGLIQRRRSGVWCYCRAESPYGEQAFSGRVAQWLYALLRDPAQAMENPEVEQLRDSPAAAEALHATLFEAVTAFDNVRRLQMLRLLAERQTMDADAFAKTLSMSHSAVARHTSKLVRRGYVQCQRHGRTLTYCLAPEPKTPIHAELWRIVASQWQASASQPSRS